jgi:alkaline phosphatase D
MSSEKTISSRTLVRRAAAALAFATLAAGASAAVQTDGPLVGAVTDTSAKIFARTDARATVRIEYSTDPSLASVTKSAQKKTLSASDFTVIAALSGLTPETTYYYRVTVDGAPQQSAPYPSFRTFPSPGAPREFTFAALTDLEHAEDGLPAPVYEKVEAEEPVLVLQLGDFDHSVPLTLGEMRTLHREARDGPYPSGLDFLTHIATRFPLFHVWDDHDYGTNDSDKTFSGRADALQAFQEYYPLPALPNSAGIWHKFTYATAEFFLLDLRSQRDPNAQAQGPTKSMLDGDNIQNGQKQWLKDGLLQSTATWKFVVTSVPMNKTAKRARRDAWSGFENERSEILNFIRDNGIDGVVFLSGDLHSGGGIDDGTNSGCPEMTVPHTNMTTGDTGLLGQWTEGILTGTGGNSGYGLVHVLRDPDRVLLEAKGNDGQVRFSYLVTLP